MGVGGWVCRQICSWVGRLKLVMLSDVDVLVKVGTNGSVRCIAICKIEEKRFMMGDYNVFICKDIL